jgi:transporter family-2 protein
MHLLDLRQARIVHLVTAVGTGCLLTLMLLFNSELARHGGALFASWTAHGTGAAVAIVLLLLLARRSGAAGSAFHHSTVPAPWWAYLGGMTGAVNVMLSSSAVNIGLALTGTQAVALSTQMLFSLAADRWGLFGLPRQRLAWRDLLPVLLIVTGSAIIIFAGTGSDP